MEKDWDVGHRAGQQVGAARRFRRMKKVTPKMVENKKGDMVPSLTAGAFGNHVNTTGVRINTNPKPKHKVLGDQSYREFK